MDQCSFCDRPRNEVKKLVELKKKGYFICNRCLTEALGVVETEPKPARPEEKPLQIPREIVRLLDLDVIAQPRAKRDVAVAIYNHYKRRDALRKGFKLEGEEGVEIQKSNILLLGPTGVGKTEIFRAIARMIGVPFYVGDATKLTQAGYVGEDVESLLQGLLADCNGEVERAEWGIILLDEADKLARKSGRGASGYRDVSGEGVQQALLKLVEGSKVKVPRGSATVLGGPADFIDTSNILFVFAGSFAGIEEIVSQRVNKAARTGFGAADRVKLNDLDVYSQVSVEDILEFGVIPELVGRLPIQTAALPLTEEEMVRVLTEPKNAIIKQFRALFAMDGIDLQFDREALLAIGREAKSLPTGCRALRSIVERVTNKSAYELPGDKTVRAVRITREVVEGKAEAEVIRELAATA